MTGPGLMEIKTVYVEVPVDVQRPSRRPDASSRDVVSLEVDSDCLRVWDQATHTAGGEMYAFPNAGPTTRSICDGGKLTEIPFFATVFRFLAEHYARNRTNPLGAFIQNAVLALEGALVEQQGSCVYFAEAGGRVKIGWSRKVATRIGQLQTGNPLPISLMGVVPGARYEEARLHERFSSARLEGEWFEATPDLMEYIASVVQR